MQQLPAHTIRTYNSDDPLPTGAEDLSAQDLG